MKFEEFKQSLTQSVDFCYNVFGEDEFLKESVINQLKKKLIVDFEEMNYFYFTPDEIEERSFFNALNSFPLLCDKKIIVLKIFDDKKIPFADKLTEYLKQPNDYTVFVLISNSSINIKGVNFTNIDCNKVSENVIKKFIQNIVKKHSATIDFDAENLLILYSNSNMAYISSELNKCLSYTQNITTDTIKELVTKHTEYQKYEFTEALGRKNKQKSIEILDNFLKNKDIIPTIIPTIYNHFRRLYFISLTNLPNSEIAKKLDMKEFAVKKQKEQLVNYDEQKLSNIIKMINDYDYKIKSGEIDLITAINSIVFSILIY